MRRALIAAAALLAAAYQQPAASPPGDGPKLVVLMVVDQLPAELLERYDTLFTGGFRRLLDDGYRFRNATHDHAFTETAPGHTTLSTGVYPSRHGIVANGWSERSGRGWRSVYSVEDLDRRILGYPRLPGRGPANIEHSGLPDWIAASDADARVVSISKKDRAAIGLAAQALGEVYWLADQGGQFITSDAYRSRYPEWVSRFNQIMMPRVYADTVWESIVPAGERALTRPDTSMYELDGVHTAFPHRPADLGDEGSPEALNHWRYEYTPFPDRAVMSFTIDAIRDLQLGQRSSVDYLGVSFSQTDLVGHHFGPWSREQLDNLLRLDQELGELLTYLDHAVGPGRWVLALSADHGVLPIPEELAKEGVDAKRLGRTERTEFMNAIQSTAGRGEDALAHALADLPFVAAAYTFDEIEHGEPADSFEVLYAHSHSRERLGRLEERWGVDARFRPDILSWTAGGTPATHGSPYYYDRHVPLIFLGSSIPAGVSDERAATVDVAPTLARLAGVRAPEDLDGRVLPGVVTH